MSLSVYLYTEKEGFRPDEIRRSYTFAMNIEQFIATQIAKDAGVFDVLYFPGRHGIHFAKDIIDHLQAGVDFIANNPNGFYELDKKHGWGLVAEFVKYIEEYIAACKLYPDYKIETY